MLLHHHLWHSLALIALIALLIPVGCNGGGATNGNRNSQLTAGFDAAGLARDLVGSDRGRRVAAADEVGAASRENQQRVVAALKGRPLTANTSEQVARRAAADGRHHMAAEWYAWPQDPPAEADARIDRRLLVIEQLIEADEIELALELCDTRLLGDYSPEIEARFAALRERASLPR